MMVLEIEQGRVFYLSKFNEYISQKEAKIRRPRPTSKLRLEYYLKIDPLGAKKVRTVYKKALIYRLISFGKSLSFIISSKKVTNFPTQRYCRMKIDPLGEKSTHRI